MTRKTTLVKAKDLAIGQFLLTDSSRGWQIFQRIKTKEKMKKRGPYRFTTKHFQGYTEEFIFSANETHEIY